MTSSTILSTWYEVGIQVIILEVVLLFEFQVVLIHIALHRFVHGDELMVFFVNYACEWPVTKKVDISIVLVL